MMQLNDTSLIVLGSLAKSKISWDSGETWTGCYPGSSVWAIGGVLDGKLVALAKTNIYKIPIVDLEAPNTETDILSFVLAAQTGAATIDAVNHTISMELVSGTDPGALTPTITLSEGASIAPGSEVEQDFTNPVVYTVTAEDQEMKEAWTVTVSVAVNVMERKAEITLYPNPASEKLFLNNLEEVNSVSLFSISGSAVLSMETPSTKAELNLGDLENGIYFISFYGKEGSVSTQKFVINR